MRVHTDIGVVCGVITGSFPTSDAAFDPTRNALELTLRLDERLRLGLADVTATIVTDTDVTKVRIDNAMDIAEQKLMNLIHGKHVFRVAGFNMVLSDEGAAVFLQNSMGTTFPVTVDEVISKQLFRAHTTELLDWGDYKLVVKSRGGDAEGPLQTSFRRVKYLRVEDPQTPVVTGYVADLMPGEPIYMNGGTLQVTGTNLAGATKVRFRYAEDGEPFHEADVVESTDTSAECGPVGYTGTLEASSGYLTAITPGGESNKIECGFNP